MLLCLAARLPLCYFSVKNFFKNNHKLQATRTTLQSTLTEMTERWQNHIHAGQRMSSNMIEKCVRNKTFQLSLKFMIPNVSLALGFNGGPSQILLATTNSSKCVSRTCQGMKSLLYVKALMVERLESCIKGRIKDLELFFTQINSLFSSLP